MSICTIYAKFYCMRYGEKSGFNNKINGEKKYGII